MLMLLAILLGAVVAIALTLKHQRRDGVEPSVQEFASFRATLAATEHSDGTARD